MPTCKRTYTRQEVAAMLYESESRQRPGTSNPDVKGHSLGLHADGRQDITDLRAETVFILGATIEESRTMDPADGIRVISTSPVGTDSRFTSRKDILLALWQGLNSSVGQAKLEQLDHNPSLPWAKFTAPLVPPIGKIERFRHAHDTAPTTGLTARGVFIYVCPIPGRPGMLHLQTCYPVDVS